MTLPVPEVRARLSVVGRGVPPRVPRGEDRARVVVRLSSPLPPLPRVCEHARGPVVIRGLPVPSASASRPGGGRRPSLPPSPLARCVVSRPAGSRSPGPARSGSGIVPLSPALRHAAACVWGGPPRPHTRSRAPARGRRLGTAAWSVGAVRRAGACPSRGGSAVLGGWPLPAPATRRPPPALLSRSSVRVPPCGAARSAPCGGVSGVSGEIPVVPSGGRRPRFSSPSPPARPRGWVFRPPCAPLARCSRASRLPR